MPIAVPAYWEKASKILRNCRGSNFRKAGGVSNKLPLTSITLNSGPKAAASAFRSATARSCHFPVARRNPSVRTAVPFTAYRNIDDVGRAIGQTAGDVLLRGCDSAEHSNQNDR